MVATPCQSESPRGDDHSALQKGTLWTTDRLWQQGYVSQLIPRSMPVVVALIAVAHPLIEGFATNSGPRVWSALIALAVAAVAAALPEPPAICRNRPRLALGLFVASLLTAGIACAVLAETIETAFRLR